MLPDEEGKIAFELDIGTSDLLAVELLDGEAPLLLRAARAVQAVQAVQPRIDSPPPPWLRCRLAPAGAGRRRVTNAASKSQVSRSPPDEDPTASLSLRSPMAALEIAASERVEADVETVVERE